MDEKYTRLITTAVEEGEVGFQDATLGRADKGQFTRCDLYHMILLYYCAETNEIIYESGFERGCVQLKLSQ